MSGTLHLIDRLLAIGRNLHRYQQDDKALHTLGRLAAFPELPTEVAVEVQVCLAEIHLRRHGYHRARRHLGIALLYRPDSARYHYLIATALAKGHHRDPERALEHYRQSLALDPNQPRCRAEFGWLSVVEGKIEEGLQLLHQAVEQAPDDLAILARLLRGLCRAGKPREARGVLLAARFRYPGDGRFRRLYDNFMFRRLHARQQAERRAGKEEVAPLLLPFVRPTTPATPAGGVRQDEAQPLPGPHRRRRSHRSDWKHG
jgi:tetratricopeptide (TPR) repeat protein